MSVSVLVTGAAGFIGSHVAEHLVKRGCNVVALDDLSGGSEQNVPKGAEFVRGDILDHALIDALFDKNQFEYVYHLAAYAAEGLSHFIRRFNYQNNLIGSVNLINASIRYEVKCFVFTSSIAVYGSNQLPMTEGMVPQPEDPYGIAKAAVESDLKAAHEMFGLPYVIFRPHNVYGERQNLGDRYRNVIGIFMNALMQEQPMTIFGDGEQTRAFSYIGDVAPVIAESAFDKAYHGEIFNVGADEPCSVNGLAEHVAHAFSMAPQCVHLPARNEVLHAYADHSKLNRLQGGGRTTSLQEGITRMAAWAKAHGPCESSTFGAIEVERNLPPSWAQSS